MTTLLICNRGEIARRIMRTARQTFGFRVLVIASPIDATTNFALEADGVLLLKGNKPSESYLDIATIIQLATENQVDYIHPGYGFLSENAEFARACAEVGIKFIGPSPAAIDIMGDKAKAKSAMAAAGVPLIPGYDGHDQSLDTMKIEAKRIGYPILIKAVMGGGGRGMRIVSDESQLAEDLESAKREGQQYFNDGRVMLEKYISEPRHIEVQIFGDSHGNVFHLFERECSMQRRHQKIIEEAPAAAPLTSTLQESLFAAAIQAGKAVQYQGAGTVEFLVKGNDFYFMEMNTRLQVEHPVSEMITGLDFVALQIKIAMGEKITPPNLSKMGHAIEVRLTLEDDEFNPDFGQIIYANLPKMANIRVDSAFDSGNNPYFVAPYYDSMVGKIISYGATRAAAIGQLIRALQQTKMGGRYNNRGFLLRILQSSDFINGVYSTKTMDSNLHEYQKLALSPSEAHEIAMLNTHNYGSIGFFNNPKFNHEFTVNGVKINHEMRAYGITPTHHKINDGQYWVSIASGDFLVDFNKVFAGADDSQSQKNITCPLSATIVKINKIVGDNVQKGEVIMILESMKMEYRIQSTMDGTIGKIYGQIGQTMTKNTLLVELE